MPVQSKLRATTLAEFQKSLGVRFRNIALLNTALTHRSYANELGNGVSNEKLEFLGDAVLDLAISDSLMYLFPDAQEGVLTQLRSHIVSKPSLMKIAKQLELGSFLLISPSEDQSGGRKKRAILADAMEAVIGAYYVDRGFKHAKKALLRWFESVIQDVQDGKQRKDYKSILQYTVQHYLHKSPAYAIVKRSGPIHNQVFSVHVKINGEVYGEGKGKTKKEAEQAAARLAYTRFSSEKRGSSTKKRTRNTQ